MQDGVFRAADIQIHRHPGFLGRGIYENFRVLWIYEAQVIPAGAGPLRHGVGLAPARASAPGALNGDPGLDTGQRRFSGSGRQVLFHFREQDRQLVFGNRYDSACSAVDQRDRLSPVALAGEDPVPQFEIDFSSAYILFFQPGRYFFYGFGGLEAVYQFRIYRDTLFAERLIHGSQGTPSGL